MPDTSSNVPGNAGSSCHSSISTDMKNATSTCLLVLFALLLCLAATTAQTPALRTFATQQYNRNLLSANPALLDVQGGVKAQVSHFSL